MSYPSAELRAAHQKIRDELAAKRQQLAEQRRTSARLREQAVAEPSRDIVGRVTESVNAEGELQNEVEELREREHQSLHQISAVNGGGRYGSAESPLSIGARLADPGVRAELAKRAGSSTQFGPMLLGEIPREELVAWAARRAQRTVTTPPGMTQPALSDIVPEPTPEPTFLGVLPAEPMDTPSVLFAQQRRTGGGIAPAAPGQTKPRLDFEFVPVQVSPTTLAGFTKIDKATQRDVDGLLAAIDTSLRDAARTALEREVIDGTGDVSDIADQEGLRGLLRQTGIGVVDATDSPIDDIRRAKTVVRAVGGIPSFVAVNELDAEAIDLSKTTTEEYMRDPFAPTPIPTLWGMTLVPTMGVDHGTMIVGDRRGFTLLVREAAQVLLSDSDADDFSRNRRSILVEMSVALKVAIPAYFVVVGAPEDAVE